MLDKFSTPQKANQIGLNKEYLVFEVQKEPDLSKNQKFDIIGPTEVHFTSESQKLINKGDK